MRTRCDKATRGISSSSSSLSHNIQAVRRVDVEIAISIIALINHYTKEREIEGGREEETHRKRKKLSVNSFLKFQMSLLSSSFCFQKRLNKSQAVTFSVPVSVAKGI